MISPPVRRKSFALVFAEPIAVAGVQRHPSPAEEDVILSYMDAYEEAMGFPPHGLHFLPLVLDEETTPVWFPPNE